jgi:Ca-activated chloride channel family protein
MNAKTMFDYKLVAQSMEQELKLLIRLTAPAGTARKRKPLNLGVVIDRSGSMAGEKLENTKRAVKTLITHLGPEDYLSLVQFDDNSEVLLEPALVKDKHALHSLVDRIECGGSTNLSAGWLQGIKQIDGHASPERISRCLLLTDGEANVGIQDLPTLALLGGSTRKERGIVTTTLGFGEGFNEDLLTAIAKNAGGAFYFVDTPEQAPAIFKEELQGLLQLVAQNIEVVLTPQEPVTMVAQWTDFPAKAQAKGIVFALGDAYAGEEKNLLVSLRIPGLKELGPATVASLSISFMEIGTAEVSSKVITHTAVRVHVTDEASARDAQPEVEVLEQYGLHLAAKARKQAISEADAGDYVRAGRTLSLAMETLGQFSLPGPALQEEVQDLKEQAQRLDASTYAHRRKIMAEQVCNAQTANFDRIRASRARRSTGETKKPNAVT